MIEGVHLKTIKLFATVINICKHSKRNINIKLALCIPVSFADKLGKQFVSRQGKPKRSPGLNAN